MTARIHGTSAWRWLAAGLLAGVGAAPLYAAEHVTLKNGFDLICDHREQVGEKMRLYLEPGSNSFVELDPAEVDTVEAMPVVPVQHANRERITPATGRDLSTAELHEMLAKAGARHNLDVDLLASVVRAESGGNARALSRAGARGLMQLMPKTAAELGVSDSFRPEENIGGGSAYLDALLTRYHDNLAFALAAYNAGPAAVDRWHGVPPYRETRAYVARIICQFNASVRLAAREQVSRRDHSPAPAHEFVAAVKSELNRPLADSGSR